MKIEIFKLNRSVHGSDLLDCVAARLALSRKKAKALLDARAVQVNGHPVWMARHRVVAGDIIRVLLPEPPAAGKPLLLTVLFEDADCLVIDKPPGMLSNEQGSVESRIRAMKGEADICAVHRLDRDTSGCLIFACQPEARVALIEAFRAGQVTKQYHALTWGRTADAEMAIASFIDGQRAVTHIRALDANRMATHWLVRIETGRTHQIRKHLSRQGCPVVGDRQYRGACADVGVEAPRQMLHASRVTFPHPRTSAIVRASAPLPADFQQAMRRLGLK